MKKASKNPRSKVWARYFRWGKLKFASAQAPGYRQAAVWMLTGRMKAPRRRRRGSGMTGPSGWETDQTVSTLPEGWRAGAAVASRAGGEAAQSKSVDME